MKFLTAIFSAFLLCLSLSNAQASPFSISEQQINEYLQKKGEVTDKLGLPGIFAVDYSIKELKSVIGANNMQRVELSGLVDAIINISGKRYPAKLNLSFDTVPYYNAEEGALYLRDLRILRWSGEPASVMDQLQGVMPLLSEGIAALLSKMPVYTLDDSDMKQMLIKKFAKEIKVEPGQVELIGGLL